MATWSYQVTLSVTLSTRVTLVLSQFSVDWIEAAWKCQALNFWPIEFVPSVKASVIRVTVIENLRKKWTTVIRHSYEKQFIIKNWIILWIMQFKSFQWFSHHDIISYPTSAFAIIELARSKLSVWVHSSSRNVSLCCTTRRSKCKFTQQDRKIFLTRNRWDLDRSWDL